MDKPIGNLDAFLIDELERIKRRLEEIYETLTIGLEYVRCGLSKMEKELKEGGIL